MLDMNQGKLEVVKQEMARVNIDILGISELKWTGEFLFWYPIILPFHTVHRVLKARILKWLPSPVDHILSDLSTMTRPSCVGPHGMA